MTGPAVPQRLAAPEAGWTDSVDVVVIGSGVAGLTAALRARELGTVLVVTKDVVASGSTQWAQGGIAAALDPEDSPEDHLQDTLVAGAGLSDPEAVRVLVTEGPDAVRDLIDLGARFDTMADGEISLGREGGHHRNRIAHAGGDATGAEIERALVAAVKRAKDIRLVEHALVLDLLTAADGSIAGVTLHVMGEGQLDGVGAIRSRAVILASGGLGQLYAATTNPSVSTGDGMALALRAGAKVRDLEFVQFHPTVLWLGKSAKGQQPLVSEAVRGEGAFLVDHTGKRFMQGQHELADLAPRDIVAKAIMRQMLAAGKDHVYLDARHFGDEKWRVRFPTILASCRSHGIDPVRELIPVAPACHYSSGGVWTDLNGQTSVPGLYACGEVACTGVHGANRLASNSLLEGLVFARRIAAHLANGLPEQREPVVDRRTPGLVDADVVPELQRAMTVGAGVIRSATGLSEAGAAIGKLIEQPYDEPGTPGWEATNLVTVASALIAAATAREESRGAHWREDHPDRDDLHWFGSLDVTLDQQAVPQATFVSRESEENDRNG
ncbi:L-aspartate oxidase [Kribbella sp. VKM Ac-2571]|uniref:L-aspartate oxidase n=1 Tax=Kribbella sp. VKM Ac-2571 TaxID=2512222 RepID=UPI00105BF1CD|nr:L-aspartate oxidase [Kribbella sp. VKM Ac-2571]TDO62431.1 L-aspartate oxidase [Kribbella sp. VKM Ac-2571]